MRYFLCKAKSIQSRYPEVMPSFVYICVIANFMCLAFYKSNVTPLLILAAVGIASLFTGKKPRPSVPGLLFFLLATYLILTDIFLFPETSGFVIYRRMLYAFFAGLGVYQIYRTDRATFLLQYNFCFLVMLLAYLLYCAVIGNFSSIFMKGRLVMSFNHANALAMTCAVAVVSAVSCLLFPSQGQSWVRLYSPLAGLEKLIHNRIFLIVSAVVSSFTLYFTLSRTSFYACLMVVLALMIVRFYQKQGLRAAIVGGIVFIAALAALIAILGSMGNSRVLNMAEPWKADTFVSRKPIWESGLAAFYQKPVFGNGPQSFGKTHEQFVRENYQDLVNKYGEMMVQGDTEKAPHVHNQYIMFLAENGLIGLLLFLLFIFYPLASSVRHKTFYGVTIPILLLFMIIYCFEVPLSGSQSSAFGVTILFMLLGYFSAGRRAENLSGEITNPPARPG